MVNEPDAEYAVKATTSHLGLWSWVGAVHPAAEKLGLYMDAAGKAYWSAF